MERRDILENAIGCVCGDREHDYGAAEDNFARIARLWEVYLHGKAIPFGKGISIEPADVGVMMALFKIGRIMGGSYKADSYVDACGYLACAGEIEGNE